ncbi:MAG: enoyl-CoA hydratase/isomerase family protein [Salinarimonadaceae bacterium]|nr:MAG: enoyl-CoA hydratase/isomerase family protein [Salinarimonadaceae bacterium]
MAEQNEAICERVGSAGVITLNRPHALNALTLSMVRDMRAALEAWAGDAAITRVVVQGSGEKAFCAGGDIRKLVEAGKAGRPEEALAFWREEYELNALIAAYPKPYISLIDGICMGGGVGVSLHGSHRVAGERYLFAMPEVGIGFFPDVGASYALPRLPGRAGLYLALTGARLKYADALSLGLATHAAVSADFDPIREALAAGEDVDAVLGRHRRAVSEAPLLTLSGLIDRVFDAASVEEILANLDFEGSEVADGIAKTIRAKSPTSLRIAYEQVRRGAELDFREAMRMEFRIVSRILDGRDFYEGVRAVLIDKDQTPRWDPARLEDVADADVEAYFAPLGDRELVV